MYNWPLAKNNFTWLDRLKICGFFLNPKNRWTQDKYVRRFEKIAADYVGSSYAVFVSSGSAANQLIAQYRKEELILSGQWPSKNKVIVSAVTWQTNVSVWIQLGFEPIFVDVNLRNCGMDLNQVHEICKNRSDIACIFPTSVLGMPENSMELEAIQKKYKVPVCLDCCENSESKVNSTKSSRKQNQCSLFTSSTSCFVAHQWSNGMEGGFIFTNSSKEYEYFILARAHGLNRNLLQYSQHPDDGWGAKFRINHNPLVENQFDFQILSSNFRNTEIAAFTGILDSRRWIKHRHIRESLDLYFQLSRDKYHLVSPSGYIPFCFPIIAKTIALKERVIGYLKAKGIEYRPFISGNMLRQLPYQKYGSYEDFPNAEYLNNHAIYIGLNYDLTNNQVHQLAQDLNTL